MAVVKRIGSLEYSPEGISANNSLNPTPLEFDRFLPWILTGADIPNKVQVYRINIGDDSSKKIKKLSKRAFSKVNVSETSAVSVKTNSSSSMSNATPEIYTKVSAFYTSNGQLVEVAFINCQLPVPSIVFEAIRLCLPYHPQLTRITWNGDYLTGYVIHEISKMFVDSFLTDVILDNSCAPSQNYYILLDSAKLKYLSLRCCEINDEVCEKIAERIQRNRPGENLVALNLAVNFITDIGAKALGYALRTNRRLSYLNLCCNSITSDGAAYILIPLTKFPLNPDEIMIVKKKRWRLARQKIRANKIYLGDITNVDKKLDKKKRKASKGTNAFKEQVQTEKATDSEGLVADNDIFMSNIEVTSDVWFSMGNMTLCSLNLAYNRLDLSAVSQIADVLSYQYSEYRGSKGGMIRVVIEGNLLPKESPKYDLIDKYMRLALNIPANMTENIGRKGSNRALPKTKGSSVR